MKLNIQDINTFLRKQTNRFYLWTKLGFTFLLALMWLADSQLFAQESNAVVASALIAAILSTLIFGVIFRNQPFRDNYIRTFILIDLVITFVLLLPVYHADIAFVVLNLLLIMQINLVLQQKNQILISVIYFGLLAGMLAVYQFNGQIQTGIREAFVLVLFNVIGYLLLMFGERILRAYEAEISRLQNDHSQLISKHDFLSKEVRQTSQRLNHLNKDLKRKSYEIQNILNLSGQIGADPDSKKVISNFLLTMVGQMGASHALYLGHKDNSKNYFVIQDQKGIHDKRIQKLRIYKDSFLVQIQKATRDPILIKEIPREHLYRDEQELLNYFDNDLISPIMVRNRVIGMFIIGGKLSGHPFTTEDINLISILSNQAAFIIEQSSVHEEIYDFYNKTVRALLRAQEMKDIYSRGHAVRTAQYVNAVGRRMDYSASDLKHLTYGTILHDIGKIALRDELLHYDKKFNGHDDDIKKKILDHTVLGASILKGVGFKEDLVDLALHHHEWYNGKGYPHGLSGNEISLGARILSVCNAYDAMMSDKPYRKSLQEEWSREQLLARAGKQFDPEVVDLFLHEIETNPGLSKLNNRPVA